MKRHLLEVTARVGLASGSAIATGLFIISWDAGGIAEHATTAGTALVMCVFTLCAMSACIEQVPRQLMFAVSTNTTVRRGARTNACGTRTMNANSAKDAAPTTPSSWSKPDEETHGSCMDEVAKRHEQRSQPLSV